MAFLARWTATGATAVVTGASSGIGRELCKLLVTRGANVIANARRPDRLEELRNESALLSIHSNPLTIVAGDITDAGVRQSIIARASEIGGGKIDLLVNNAGIGALGPFAAAHPDRLRRIMEVNFFAPVELSRLAFPLLCRGRCPVLCNISTTQSDFFEAVIDTEIDTDPGIKSKILEVGLHRESPARHLQRLSPGGAKRS
jgi:NAD(P)-dependent dehydrogenase (short-subunit alcohol dehydrogenase family)